jgi:hypothetical protein
LIRYCEPASVGLEVKEKNKPAEKAKEASMSKKMVMVFVGVLIAGAGLFAQWSDDPAVNTVISDTTGTQIMPKIVVKDNGESFVSWFSAMVGWRFDVYMQRLDPDGNKLWAEEGLLISDNPTESWVSDYGLALDSDSFLVLVNHDFRTGYGDAFAWRISPEGQFLWGNDGIQLTNDTFANYSPNLLPLEQGDIVFVWHIVPPDTLDEIQIGLQRLSKEGQPQWGSDLIIGDTMHNYLPAILRTEDDNFILAWNRAESFDTVPGQENYLHIFVQKFDSGGNPMWTENVQVDTGDFLPVDSPIHPYLANDGNNGAFIVWEAEMLFTVTTRVQHIDADGNLQYPPNGVEVSTLDENTHAEPDFCFLPQTQELFVFWSEFYYDAVNRKDNFGIYGQKFSYAGQRLWGDSGKVFEPLVTDDTSFFDIIVKPGPENDVAVLYVKSFSVVGPNHVRAMRIDNDGNFVWDDEKIVLSSVPSDKYNLAASDFAHNQWIAVWADGRNSPPDQDEFGIYAQNINSDGSLGLAVIEKGKGELASSLTLYPISPNPSGSEITIRYALPEETKICLKVYDASGTLVRVLADKEQQSGVHSIFWNGRDERGRALSSGVYFARLECGREQMMEKIVMVR